MNNQISGRRGLMIQKKAMPRAIGSRYFHLGHKHKQELCDIFGPQWTIIEYQLCYNVFSIAPDYIQKGIIDFLINQNASIRHLIEEFRYKFMEELLESIKGKYMIVSTLPHLSAHKNSCFIFSLFFNFKKKKIGKVKKHV